MKIRLKYSHLWAASVRLRKRLIMEIFNNTKTGQLYHIGAQLFGSKDRDVKGTLKLHQLSDTIFRDMHRQVWRRKKGEHPVKWATPKEQYLK